MAGGDAVSKHLRGSSLSRHFASSDVTLEHRRPSSHCVGRNTVSRTAAATNPPPSRRLFRAHWGAAAVGPRGERPASPARRPCAAIPAPTLLLPGGGVRVGCPAIGRVLAPVAVFAARAHAWPTPWCLLAPPNETKAAAHARARAHARRTERDPSLPPPPPISGTDAPPVVACLSPSANVTTEDTSHCT